MNKIWIVSYRHGEDMQRPDICSTEEEAKALASEFINCPAYEAWAADNPGEKLPDLEELQVWADNREYVLNDTCFWDGAHAHEAFVTEYTAGVNSRSFDDELSFTVSVCDGEVFINDSFVAQLCWDANAVGSAIACWLREQEGGKDAERTA